MKHEDIILVLDALELLYKLSLFPFDIVRVLEHESCVDVLLLEMPHFAQGDVQFDVFQVQCSLKLKAFAVEVFYDLLRLINERFPLINKRL